jgi:DNA-binding transcriptional LysR family regulator
MPELEDIKAFVEVVETGGFSRAAERLGVSKSIVSRRISRLESELGTRLLSRTTRGISPTEAGVEMKSRGDRILLEMQEAQDAVAQRGGDVVGKLRLTLPQAFGVRHVAPVLANLLARHPRLSIDAVYTDRLVDLIAERFDAAIRIGVLQDSSLVARRIAPIRAGVVASPAYLKEHGAPKTPEDLMRHACLIYTGTRQPHQWRFREGKKWTSVRVEGRMLSDNGDAIVTAAIAGLGIAMVPTFLVASAIESGTLKHLLLDCPMDEAGLYLVRPPGAYVPGKVRALQDALIERFGGDPDWDACEMQARKLLKQGVARTGSNAEKTVRHEAGASA